MILLSVDTSSPMGSLSLHKGQTLLAVKTWNKKITVGGSPSHSELLTASFSELLLEAKIAIDKISHLAVGIGPGSFTGIRVGINFGRALAYARGLPVFTADSLSVIAQSVDPSAHPKDLNLLVLVSAFRNFLYYSQFAPGISAWTLLEGPGVTTIEDLRGGRFSDCLLVGAGARQRGAYLDAEDNSNFPHAKDLARLALANFTTNDKFKTWNEIIPLYVRRSEAEEKFGVITD